MFKKVFFFALLFFIPLFLTGCISLINKENNGKVNKENSLEKSEKSKIPLFLDPWFNELEQPVDKRVAFQYKAIPRHPKYPPAPINIEVIDPNIGTILNIKWTNPKEIVFKNIHIYRSIEKNRIGKLIATLDGRATFFQDKELERNKTYYYTIRSVILWTDPNDLNNIKEQESDNIEQKIGRPIDKVPPFPPKDIQIIAGQKSGNLFIKWINPIDEDFDHIQIYRSEMSNQIGLLIGSNIKDTYFQDKELKDNQPYYYILTAIDKSGNESLIKLMNIGKTEPFEVFKEGGKAVIK